MTEEAGVKLIPAMNLVKIGELELQTNTMNMQELIGLALGILKNKEARDYLDLIKSKRKLNGTTFYD